MNWVLSLVFLGAATCSVISSASAQTRPFSLRCEVRITETQIPIGPGETVVTESSLPFVVTIDPSRREYYISQDIREGEEPSSGPLRGMTSASISMRSVNNNYGRGRMYVFIDGLDRVRGEYTSLEGFNRSSGDAEAQVRREGRGPCRATTLVPFPARQF